MQDTVPSPAPQKGVRTWVIETVPKVIMALGDVLAVFWSPKSAAARDFSKAERVPDGAPDALVPVTEHRDADEDQVFRDVMFAFSGDCLAYKKGDGKEPQHEDLHWGYTKGLIEGALEIHSPGDLPAECQVGLFATPGHYDVVARPNFLRDEAKIQISRFSLKIKTPFDVANVYTLEGKAQELDLLLSEGIRQADSERGDQDGQGFFFRDARQLRYMHWFEANPLLGLPTLLNQANGTVFKTQQEIMSLALDRLYVPEQNLRNWAEKDYYSAGPYRLGETLIKYGLRTRQPSKAAERQPSPAGLSKDQRRWFEDWQSAAEPAVFDLCIQVARFGAIPEPRKRKGDPCKAVMASEYTDLVWDETVSEFLPVGTLTLYPSPAPRSATPWYFASRDRWYPEDALQPEALRFNAWNTLPEMAPVGQLFRARKQVHSFHRETRLRHTFAAEKNLKAFCPMH